MQAQHRESQWCQQIPSIRQTWGQMHTIHSQLFTSLLPGLYIFSTFLPIFPAAIVNFLLQLIFSLRIWPHLIRVWIVTPKLIHQTHPNPLILWMSLYAAKVTLQAWVNWASQDEWSILDYPGGPQIQLQVSLWGRRRFDTEEEAK